MPSWSEAKKILAVRLDTLGDVLMTTPALRALKSGAASPTVTLLTSAPGAAAARLVPEVDGILDYGSPWMKATALRGPDEDFRMIERLRARRFDAAVIFTVFSQSALPAALLCHLAGIPLRLAHCRENPYQLLSDWVKEPEPEKVIRHEVRRHLDLVSAVGFTTPDERLSLSVPTAARDRVSGLLRELGRAPSQPLVVVHPGATAASRRYPPEQFAEAARTLQEQHGARILLTGDSGEAELLDDIRRRVGPPAVALAGRLDLGELAALIDAADVLLVNNTGPAHMAAALGTPVVDLYALTNPQHTPWQVESRVLSHDVPCRNCFKSVCPEGHNNCLRLVSPRDVVRAARELLSLSDSRRIPCTP